MHGAPPGHAVPQDPQLRLSVWRSTHAPPHWVFPAAVLHEPVQVPAVHSVFRGQRFPQPPQLAGSFWVSVQARPQSVSVPQVQALLTQLAPAGHGELQAPQLFASLARSTQALLQSVSAGPASVPHDVVHTPAAQTLPLPPSAAQEFPQLPQLFGSLWVAVQTPLQRCPPFAHWQTPLWQVVPPVQRMLQPPQFASSVCWFTHWVPHRRRPEAQTHFPPLQVSPAGHWTPQPPQFCGFVAGSTQTPLQ